VEDVLKKGVISTPRGTTRWPTTVEDVLNNGKQMK